MSKILVIDDDADMQLAIRLCLESKGYQVIEAKCASEGLHTVKTVKPDLIILDVMMGTATEGFQTALKLRSPDPHSEYLEFSTIPIVMLTAIHSTTPVRFAPDQEYLPVDKFIDKPLVPEVLLAAVDQLLRN